jgi:hypothetical protein
MAPQKTKPPPSKLREASASAVILRQRNPWRSQGLPTKDVCTPSGTPIRKIRIGMGAGLNCWRLLLLVRGARICEIPDDAEMKGHHRICHLKDGTVSGMKLISTSGDVALEVPGATSQVAIRSHRCPANSLPRISHCGSPSTTTPKRRTLTLPPRVREANLRRSRG